LSSGIALVAVAAAASPSSAITSYTAAFFAGKQPTTALDMVRLLPGFEFDQGSQTRGFGGGAGNVLIDGERPTSKDDALDEVLKRIPAGSVLRVDLIRGGAPGIDMQDKTILANVIRRSGGSPRLTVSTSGVVLDDGRATAGARIEGSAQLGRAEWEGSLLLGQGFDDTGGTGPRTQRTPEGGLTLDAMERAKGKGANLKATQAVEGPALGGKVRFNASVVLNRYRYTQIDDPTTPGFAVTEDDHTRQDTEELGVRYDRALGAKARLEMVLLQQFGGSRYAADYAARADLERFTLSKRTSESIGRATVNFQLTPVLSGRLGGEGDFNALSDHTRYVVNSIATTVPAANVHVTELRGEGFADTTWRPLRALTLEAGLRLEASHIASTGDVIGARTFYFPKPRIALSFSPDDADQFRARIEREVGQLDFDDFTAGAASLTNSAVHAGNPSLTPEQSWVYEIAFDRRLWGGAQLTATLRRSEMSYIIDRAPVFDPSGVYDAPGNIGAGTKDEAILSLTVPTDRFGLRNGTLTVRETLRQSRVIDPTTGRARSISGLRPQIGEIHFAEGLPAWKASWGFDVFGQFRETYYRFNEIDTDKLKTFASIYFEYKPTRDLSFKIELENIGGRSYRHSREIFSGPRSTFPLEYVDIRDLRGPRSLYFRLRKTFN
jgi:outer membrane receptor protein involved in Fe transport